jgi:dihydroorotase
MMLDRRRLLLGALSLGCVPAQAQGLPFDLLVRGGRVVDPSQGLNAILDVGLKNGLVAAVTANLNPGSAAQVYDATNKIVTAGLIDLHTHCWPGGNYLGTAPDTLMREELTTTVVSAGDPGPQNVGAFRAGVVNTSAARVFAFVQVSSGALHTFPVTEIPTLDYLNVQNVANALIANADILLGVKVRMSYVIAGNFDLQPLQRAIQACQLATQATGVPFRVMCHIGGLRTPALMGDIVNLLRPGDIITHAFVGYPNQANQATGLAQGFACIPAAFTAKQKGVILDCAWGGSPAGQPNLGGSFDYLTALICMIAGLRLDTLSSDSHAVTAINGGRMHLTEVMSNFLGLTAGAAVNPPLVPGVVNPVLTLDDVVRATTMTPGQVIGRVPLLGTLQTGAPGDVAILELLTGTFQFNDSQSQTLSATQKLVPIQAIKAGALVV